MENCFMSKFLFALFPESTKWLVWFFYFFIFFLLKNSDISFEAFYPDKWIVKKKIYIQQEVFKLLKEELSWTSSCAAVVQLQLPKEWGGGIRKKMSPSGNRKQNRRSLWSARGYNRAPGDTTTEKDVHVILTSQSSRNSGNGPITSLKNCSSPCPLQRLGDSEMRFIFAWIA